MNSKTYEIQETVEWLKGRFGPSLVVVDHWESDMAATGLEIESQPDRLVYIATEAPPNTYFVELETAPYRLARGLRDGGTVGEGERLPRLAAGAHAHDGAGGVRERRRANEREFVRGSVELEARDFNSCVDEAVELQDTLVHREDQPFFVLPGEHFQAGAVEDLQKKPERGEVELRVAARRSRH